jgi:hypothetical protein
MVMSTRKMAETAPMIADWQSISDEVILIKVIVLSQISCCVIVQYALGIRCIRSRRIGGEKSLYVR